MEEICDDSYFVLKQGSIPIIISAPHATPHFRDGKYKQRDVNTGVIAELLHKKTDCSIIYTTKSVNADANYDRYEDCLYKQALVDFINENDIKLLIDLHGMTDDYDYVIEFGTADDKSLCGRVDIKEQIINSFKRNLLSKDKDKIAINQRFKAEYKYTVTNCISNICNVPCIQIEISRKYRDNCKLHLVVKAIVDVINEFNF